MQEEYDLTEIHRELIAALNEFDTICNNNSIRYSLHGGAVLGAKRNGKLIPWDDDLDVSMTREEYVKFKKACEQYTGLYYLNEIDTWLPRFATRDKTKPIVFIDIFIWDFISEKKFFQFLKINLLRMFQGMLKRNIDFKRYDWKGKVLVGITSILGWLLSRRIKLKLFNVIGEKLFLGKKQYIHRSNDAFKSISYIFDKDYMKEYTFIQLEGKKYMVSSRYEEFLIRSYGVNYLIPPPKNERKPLHDFQRKSFLHEK